MNFLTFNSKAKTVLGAVALGLTLGAVSAVSTLSFNRTFIKSSSTSLSGSLLNPKVLGIRGSGVMRNQSSSSSGSVAKDIAATTGFLTRFDMIPEPSDSKKDENTEVTGSVAKDIAATTGFLSKIGVNVKDSKN